VAVTLGPVWTADNAAPSTQPTFEIAPNVTGDATAGRSTPRRACRRRRRRPEDVFDVETTRGDRDGRAVRGRVAVVARGFGRCGVAARDRGSGGAAAENTASVANGQTLFSVSAFREFSGRNDLPRIHDGEFIVQRIRVRGLRGSMPSGALRFVGRAVLALVAAATSLAGCASAPQAGPSFTAYPASLPTPPPRPMPKVALAYRAATDLEHTPRAAALRPALRGHGHDGAGWES
jgi:hypothetical protein